MNRLTNLALSEIDLCYYPTMFVTAQLPRLNSRAQTVEMPRLAKASTLFAPSSICLPYGTHGRQLLVWLTTYMVVRKNPAVRLPNSKSVFDFFDQAYHREQGARMTQQLMRLMTTVFVSGQCDIRSRTIKQIEKYSFHTAPLVNRGYLNWVSDKSRDEINFAMSNFNSEGELEASYLEVGDYFFDLVTHHGALPLSFAHVKSVFGHRNRKRVPWLFDLYCLLMLRRNHDVPFSETLTWDYLAEILCASEVLRHRRDKSRFKRIAMELLETIQNLGANIHLKSVSSDGVEYSKSRMNVPTGTALRVGGADINP